MRPLRYSLLWLSLGWLAVIAVVTLSLITLPTQLIVEFRYADKFQHIIAYGVLMGWFVQIFHSRWALTIHALVLLIMGVALEYLQAHTGRMFDYYDMVANLIGVGTGLLLLLTPWRSLLLKIEQRFLSREA